MERKRAQLICSPVGNLNARFLKVSQQMRKKKRACITILQNQSTEVCFANQPCLYVSHDLILENRQDGIIAMEKR